MNGSLNKKYYYAFFVVILLIVWLIAKNLKNVEVVKESQKLTDSASKTIKQGTQKFKERYIDNDENISGKLKQDILELGDKYQKGVEKTADLAIEKSKQVGQTVLDQGKTIVQKVSDYVDPEEVVKVGFSKAVNPETFAAAHTINFTSLESAAQKSALQKMAIAPSCDVSTLAPKYINAKNVLSCHYAWYRFNNSQSSCIASANNSLRIKNTELISGTVQSLCDKACEHKKAFESCIDEHEKEQDLGQRPSDEMARQAVSIKNASAEYQCIDNDLVIAELARLRQLVRQCKKDKNCDIQSEAFKQQYADESQRILYFYDHGREELFDSYQDNNFVEQLNTNSMLKTEHVSRALFTTDVKQREPVDNVCIPQSHKMTFFTEINNYAHHRVTHRWKYNNKTLFELSFNVRGPRWRVWTIKNISSKKAGPWVVEVVDEDGNILAQKLFYNSP